MGLNCLAITNGPLADGVLAKKLVKRIAIAIRTSAARLDSKQMRQLIHGAIEAEASRDEILMVEKMATIASIRSISAGAAILVKEASMEELDLGTAVRKTRMKKAGDASSVIEKVKAAGLWNEEWDHVYFLALVWIEEFMLAVISVYESKVLSRKEIELLNVALGASHTPINAVGVQRHIGDAFRSGATVDEIVEVFKICVWRKQWEPAIKFCRSCPMNSLSPAEGLNALSPRRNPDDLNRAFRIVSDRLGDAPEQSTIEASTTVRAHNN